MMRNRHVCFGGAGREKESERYRGRERKERERGKEGESQSVSDQMTLMPLDCRVKGGGSVWDQRWREVESADRKSGRRGIDPHVMIAMLM